MARKTKEPRTPKGAAGVLPPDHLRCSYVWPEDHPRAGERCQAWAALRHGLRYCSGHAKFAVEKARAVRDQNLVERATEGLRGELEKAEIALRILDAKVEHIPAMYYAGGPAAYAALLADRREKQAEVNRLRQEIIVASAGERPERTAEMLAAGLHWVVVEEIEHGPWPGDLISTGRWKWERRPLPVPIMSPANKRPPDPDVERKVVEAGERLDRARERQVEADKAALQKRLAEVQHNGYAAAFWGAKVGLSADEYLRWLTYELATVAGHAVDLSEELSTTDEVPEFRTAVAPEIRKAAKRGAWSGISPLR
jgi:hypothetical protein